MAGKARIDQIEVQIERLERAQGGGAIDQILRTLTDEQITEIERRLTAGGAPETILQELGTR